MISPKRCQKHGVCQWASKSGSFSPTPGGRCIFLREFRWTYSSLSTLQKTIPWVLYCTLGIPGIPVIFVEVVELLWTNIWMKLRFPKYQYKFRMWRCSKLSRQQIYPCCTWRYEPWLEQFQQLALGWMAAEGKPVLGQGSGTAAGHQPPSKNVLLSEREKGWEITNSVPSLACCLT